LCLKYHFVTPLTSMVVTKPEDTEGDKKDNILLADKPTEEARSCGYRNKYSYILKNFHVFFVLFVVDGDPHFIIEVPKQNDTLCFNINEKPGVILNLVKDPDTGIVVNGQLIGDKKAVMINDRLNTYFGKIGIVNKKLNIKLEITTETITILEGEDKTVLSWLDTMTLTQGSLTLVIKQEKNLLVKMGDGAVFVVVLHRVWKKHPLHQDYLGFYTLDSYQLSEGTHGLLGQFYHDITFEVFDVRPGSDPQKPDATMVVKGNKLVVTRGWQKDYRKDSKLGTNIACWFVHHDGKGLIDGELADYIVPNLLGTM
uniref:Inter-alpha-trypsin inhibitor heavy chain C-terminal domain-containing protein n=1 Tax=Latimeria chalumnae TaxID=7897 RepID=H3A4G6_LATCH